MPNKAQETDTESAVLAGYELLGDVEITLHAELDHKVLAFEKLLNLHVGSILELSRPTGENVDVYAGDVLLGTGEILIVDSMLAIRIADLKDKSSEPGKGSR
jgi:flagellar motor switch protein FliN